MQPKKLLYGNTARDKILQGAEKLYDAVRMTMGSNGRNVLIRGRLQHIVTKDGKSVLNRRNTITKDGATVAKEVVLENPFEDTGAQIVNEAADRTNDESGDGTTSATVLAYAMMKSGMNRIRRGANAIAMKRGIDMAVASVVATLKTISKPLKNQKQLEAIATISSQDPEIGKVVAEVMTKVGEDGIVSVEEGVENGISYEYTEGMLVDAGYIVPHFITDHHNNTCILEDVPILITDQKLMRFAQVLPLLERLDKKGVRRIVVFCETCDGGALASFISNVVEHKMEAVVIRAPLYDTYRLDILQDIATMTAGTALIREYGKNLEDAKPEQLGYARRVVVSKDETIIVDGGGMKSDVENRILTIKNDIEKADKDFDKEFMQKRIARMAGGVGVIRVGAFSDIERIERQHRIEDAIGSTRSAWQEGITVGSGKSYIVALDAMTVTSKNRDEQAGIDIVKEALVYPCKQIAENCGENPKKILKQVRNAPASHGYNGNTGNVENLYDANVIDPTKVNRVALEHAASVAGMFLTLECVMAEIEEDPDEVPYARNAKDAFRKMKK